MTRQVTSRNPTSRNPTTYNPVRQADKIKDPREIFGSSLILYNTATPTLVNGRYNLYQEFGGITPATTAGNPIGLVLDLHDLSRWDEVVPVSAMNGTWTGDTSGWTFSAESASYVGDGSAANPSLSGFYPFSGYVLPIELEYTISGYSGAVQAAGMLAYSLVRFPATAEVISTFVSANGTYKFRGYWRNSGTSPLVLYGGAANSFTMSRPVVRRIDGNHASQTIGANRPLLRQDSIGFYAHYNGSGHQLDAYFLTAPGANCTQYKVGLSSVTRTDGLSIGSGVVTLNNQREDIRARIIVNRAPTPEEDAMVRLWISANFGGIV